MHNKKGWTSESALPCCNICSKMIATSKKFFFGHHIQMTNCSILQCPLFKASQCMLLEIMEEKKGVISILPPLPIPTQLWACFHQCFFPPTTCFRDLASPGIKNDLSWTWREISKSISECEKPKRCANPWLCEPNVNMSVSIMDCKWHRGASEQGCVFRRTVRNTVKGII